MSGVVLLVLAIILITIFSLIYYTIFFEFDETTFSKRLRVLTEYAKRTNADKPTPDVLGHVSDVYDHTYIVSWFRTNDLSTYHETVHDDTVEVFDFLEQQFSGAQATVTQRVAPVAAELDAFVVTNDAGDVKLRCPQNFSFDYGQLKCVPEDPCSGRPPGRYPMNELLLDTLVHNQHSDKNYSAGAHLYHPTLYLRCLANGSHAVRECPDNYTFDAEAGECRVNELCEGRPDGFVLPYFPEALLVNEFVECRNGEHVVAQCADGQVFDRALMTCVHAHPCAFNGAGHTYITSDIGDTQFFKCLNNHEAQLVTCINRAHGADGQYACSGDARCADLPKGTGQLVHIHTDDTFEYASGQMICDNYEVVSEINCDTGDVLGDKLFINKFKLNVQFPLEVLEFGACAPATLNNVSVLNDTFPIENAPNDYGVNMQTSVVGRTSMVAKLMAGDDPDTAFGENVLLARDVNTVGLNPFTAEPIDCFGAQLYDVMDAHRANVCTESGNDLLKTVEFGDGAFLSVFRDDLTGSDADYKQFCAISYESPLKIVKSDHFQRRILTNILQSDICADLYTTIYQKYTTLARKYTTSPVQYNYTFVKRPENMVVYAKNTRFKNATISEPAFDLFAAQTTDKENGFARSLFDPFADGVWRSEPGGDGDHWAPEVPPTQPEPELEPESETELDSDLELEPEFSPLILNKKDLFYSCFYELPSFKLSSCHAENDVIVDALQQLRASVKVDTECELAKDLHFVLNAYAYTGNNIGCRSVFDGDDVAVVKEPVPSYVFTNLQTQSNDGVRYNKHVHVKDGRYMACPEHLYDDEAFACNAEPDKLYYLENMQQ
ncbi:capsid associated protein [Choristoneura fumiferana multiple nucleopolyhedrovirus]|uniref:Capsid-associated protein Vp91 n=1 Tax=Choristoneura fumiferana nuclear polyhedrosis virus TaxID=208973 RepID=VP91_NPVCF|nr:capsid associated protein [Choristoneura fumiferana multiple nucleopolyhedrovirus]Q7TLR9.1 RecName: Full=Capsid-associated protein Vp91; Flags: Precursor [Choristoneura fumiferana multiple nucleopolyhedrovirus]AAP29860.1 capsid associated protein [Choristoneura fumiferana multiple nucleopolyhedrovirus]